MTFSSRTVCVLCKQCGHKLMEVHAEGKIYGPYQVIAHTSRGTQREDGWLPRETVFYHHVVDRDKKGFCCFGGPSEPGIEQYNFHNVLCESDSYGSSSIQEKENINARIIWHKVHGFSEKEMKNLFEFVCCNCKRKGDLKSFEGY